MQTVGTYRAPISGTRGMPCLLCWLLDQSSSMSQPWGRGTGASKAVGVADVVNQLLSTIATRCSKGEQVQEYFEFLFVGYSGERASGLDGRAPEIMTVSQLKATARTEMRRVTMQDAGETFAIDEERDVWLTPRASGGTPMDEGFRCATNAVRAWVGRQPDCFPPICLNVTDGQPNDMNRARNEASTLAALRTSDGDALLFNCHISEKPGAPILFPASEAGLPDEYARFLFGISSELPEPLIAQGRNLGLDLQPGARGFVYNADLSSLIRFLDIGTPQGLLLAAPQ